MPCQSSARGRKRRAGMSASAYTTDVVPMITTRRGAPPKDVPRGPAVLSAAFEKDGDGSGEPFMDLEKEAWAMMARE